MKKLIIDYLFVIVPALIINVLVHVCFIILKLDFNINAYWILPLFFLISAVLKDLKPVLKKILKKIIFGK